MSRLRTKQRRSRRRRREGYQAYFGWRFMLSGGMVAWFKECARLFAALPRPAERKP